MKEYFRPWKLGSLAIGLALLIAGAYYFKQPDWDAGISLIMGILTYITAPWALRTVKALKWKLFPLAILAYWVSVDGSYMFYNAYMGHPVSVELRWANFLASSLLYLLCGCIWLPQMTMRELLEYRYKRIRS